MCLKLESVIRFSPRPVQEARSLPAGPKRQSSRLRWVKDLITPVVVMGAVLGKFERFLVLAKARRAVLLERLRNRGMSAVAHQAKPDQIEKFDARIANDNGWTHPTWRQELVDTMIGYVEKGLYRANS